MCLGYLLVIETERSGLSGQQEVEEQQYFSSFKLVYSNQVLLIKKEFTVALQHIFDLAPSFYLFVPPSV